MLAPSKVVCTCATVLISSVISSCVVPHHQTPKVASEADNRRYILGRWYQEEYEIDHKPTISHNEVHYAADGSVVHYLRSVAYYPSGLTVPWDRAEYGQWHISGGKLICRWNATRDFKSRSEEAEILKLNPHEMELLVLPLGYYETYYRKLRVRR